MLQGDLNTVSDERDEDMSFEAVFALVIDRPHRQIAFQLFEGGFDFAQLQVELPERRGIGAAHVRAQEIMSLAPSGQAQLGFIECEAEIHAPRPLLLDVLQILLVIWYQGGRSPSLVSKSSPYEST